MVCLCVCARARACARAVRVVRAVRAAVLIEECDKYAAGEVGPSAR